MAKANALAFIRQAISQGLSANAAYKQGQEMAASQGLRFLRRDTFLRMYSQNRASRAQWEAAAAQPVDQPPETVKQRDTIRARGYGTWVEMVMRTVGTGELQYNRFLVKSHAPMTPQEAMDTANQVWQQNASQYPMTLVGMTYRGTEFYTPQGDAAYE